MTHAEHSRRAAGELHAAAAAKCLRWQASASARRQPSARELRQTCAGHVRDISHMMLQLGLLVVLVRRMLRGHGRTWEGHAQSAAADHVRGWTTAGRCVLRLLLDSRVVESWSRCWVRRWVLLLVLRGRWQNRLRAARR